MRARLLVLVVTALALSPRPGSCQEPASFPPRVEARSAAEALQILLEANIEPGGPLRGDGAAIAGLLAAQSLTFPVSSSSGAFARRELFGFGPDPLYGLGQR
jgi:hypothetical protein